MGALTLRDKNVSTSGDYQQFFKQNGNRYHHILNPETGQPAQGIMSAAIITPRHATDADILSTAIFVLGHPRGLEFLEKERDLEGVIVTNDGKIHLSSGLKTSAADFPKKITK